MRQGIFADKQSAINICDVSSDSFKIIPLLSTYLSRCEDSSRDRLPGKKKKKRKTGRNALSTRNWTEIAKTEVNKFYTNFEWKAEGKAEKEEGKGKLSLVYIQTNNFAIEGTCANTVIHSYFGADLISVISVQAFFTEIKSLSKC